MATTIIKPKQIFDILDAAKAIREANAQLNKVEDFIPCFAGDSGIGKSKTQQTWAKNQGPDFKFIDIRLAYMEGPDLVGLPSIVKMTVDGKEVVTTVYALPEFLPKNGQGLIVFEEPNRAHESTMNAIMQIFTDRKIGGYKLPDGFIMSLAINPEGHYNVNALDPALKNRVAMYDVKYDHMSFVKYMQESNFNPTLTAFIGDSNLWSYVPVDEIKEEGTYISPRTISQVNNVLNTIPQSSPVWYELLAGLLGSSVASDYVKFANEIKPVLWEDIEKNKEKSLAKLAQMRDRSDYQGDMVSTTVTSVSDAYRKKKCDTKTLFEVAHAMDKDQAANLLCSAWYDLSSDELEENFKKFEKEMDVIAKSYKDAQNSFESDSTLAKQSKKRAKSKKETK